MEGFSESEWQFLLQLVKCRNRIRTTVASTVATTVATAIAPINTNI
jgi:hypothetical protein